MLEVKSDLQLLTLGTYTSLCALRPSWPGALILNCGLDEAGTALALAGIVAGGACLAIEERPELCRAAIRLGACDFAVNTVDEALRILKNEIRQRKPVSVGLELNSQAALAELRERGVLAQLFVDRSCAAEPLGPVSRSLKDADRLGALTQAHDWRMHSFPFVSSAELRAFDTRLQATIGLQDPRHRWVMSAPRLFPRDRTRHVFLTALELDALTPRA